MKVHLIRHGFDTDEVKGGWSDIGLDESGKVDIRQAALYIKNNDIPINKIISSDLVRARETSDIISNILETEVEYNSRFREFNPGILSGMKYDNINTKYPQFKVGNIDPLTPFPDGESPLEFYKRVKECLESLEDGCLYVTHRVVLEVMYHITGQLEWDINVKRFPIEHASLHVYDNGVMKKLSIK